jgi:hypothetical protein
LLKIGKCLRTLQAVQSLVHIIIENFGIFLEAGPGKIGCTSGAVVMEASLKKVKVRMYTLV